MAKVSKRKTKTPKTIDLKADAVFEESDASKATDAALEAGLSGKVDVVVDDLKKGDAKMSKADIVVDDAVIESAEAKAEEQFSETPADEKPTVKTVNDEMGGVAPIKKKSRLGLYAGTFLSAVVGGGIALGGAGALNKAGWLKYVPYADGLVYGGDTTKGAAAVEATQLEINALKVQISELRSNDNPSELIERIVALEANANNGPASVDLSSIEQAIVAASEKSEVANTNAQKALLKIDELSTSIVTSAGTAGGIDETALKALLAGQSSGVADAFETRISALEVKPANAPIDNSKLVSQINAVSTSVSTLSSRVDGVEKASQESSLKTNETLNLELSLINEKIDSEILAPMAEVKAAASAALTGQKVAHSVTARSLKAALEHGGNFSSEVFAVQALLGNNETIELLKLIAENGVQTPKQLLAGFKAVEDKIFVLESKPAKDAGVLDKFLSSAKSLVKIRPKGVVEGESAGAIASRIRAAIDLGDLDAAKTEWDGLNEETKELSTNWFDGLKTRIEAENLVSKLIEALSANATAKDKG
ncbi:MAG: hypothetical protein COC17_05420 [Hyphomicrobiales bacterium]|nr:hypothetical protein [Hyphomicrobiales bacterium]PCH50370.1 MAG: hypothetical protein COC17_05420 [Hyphomicrobiales bacterium]